MTMRVAFNATPLLSPLTGIGNYIVELGAALAEIPEIDAYSFYRYRWRHERPTVPQSGPASLNPSTFQRIKPWLPFRGTLRQAARHLGFARGLRKFRVDLYHEQNYVPLSYDVPVVITIHDLSWLHYPGAHPADRVRWLERGLPKAIERAGGILVDSNFVRDEVLSTFDVDAARVHTAHLGVPRGFHPRDSEQTAASLRPLQLEHGGYVLTVGTIEPRKNLAHILDSYALLPDALRERFPLVIAGAKGWQSSDIVDRLRRSSGRQLRFLDHVDGRALRDLYAGAALFAFPSLYEGFGLPPLEAMASGAPVIVSDRASLPEVVGEAGETMNPTDAVQSAQKLRALLEDSDRRRELVRKGIQRAGGFTWASCAKATFAVYLAALGGAEAPAP